MILSFNFIEGSAFSRLGEYAKSIFLNQQSTVPKEYFLAHTLIIHKVKETSAYSHQNFRPQ
jgi:hypothetical protein